MLRKRGIENAREAFIGKITDLNLEKLVFSNRVSLKKQITLRVGRVSRRRWTTQNKINSIFTDTLSQILCQDFLFLTLHVC